MVPPHKYATERRDSLSNCEPAVMALLSRISESVRHIVTTSSINSPMRSCMQGRTASFMPQYKVNFGITRGEVKGARRNSSITVMRQADGLRHQNHARSQDGARSSLALGWYEPGCWPADASTLADWRSKECLAGRGLTPFADSKRLSRRDCIIQPRVARNELPWG
jgi:hypothetical protein